MRRLARWVGDMVEQLGLIKLWVPSFFITIYQTHEQILYAFFRASGTIFPGQEKW
jgi:hypothetical protein